MRHLKQGRKLGRTTAHRKALMRNLATALLDHERIITTEPKAKELRRVADKLVTLGKRGNLHARRQALQVVQSDAVVQKLFNEIAPRFAERHGGYTRILRLGYRPGDAAVMAVIELVDVQIEEA
jgi:large subunit ribosomal protein L17